MQPATAGAPTTTGSGDAWRARPAHWAMIGGAILAMVILALTAFILLQVRERSLESARDEIRRFDFLLAEQTARAMQGVDLVLDNVATELQAEGIDTPEALVREKSSYAAHLALAGKIAGVPQLDALSLISSTGQVVNFSRYYPVPAINVSDRDYFKALQGGDSTQRSFVSMRVSNRGSGTETIYLARRLSGPDGRFVGLVLGAIQLEYFSALYNSIRSNNSLAISLWRADGQMLVRSPPPPPENHEATQIPPSLLGSIRRGIPTLFTTPHGYGEPRMVATMMPIGYPVIVSVTLAESAALAGWHQDAITIGTAGVGCAVLICVLTWLLMRQFGAYEAMRAAMIAREDAIRGREVAEAQLRQSQKMEAVGQLTAGLAHDFNNLLTSIIVNLDALRPPSGESRALQLVRQASERAASLTRQLLAFSRQQILQPQPIALQSVLGGMRDLLVSSVGAHVTLELRLGDTLWPAYADPVQVENMVLNLAINARDAMPDGGRLLIETFNVPAGSPSLTAEAAELADGDYICLAVRDSGTGMPAEVVARAFDPFFTTKPQGKGTGLGLSQVYGVARQSGGGVTIDTAPGEGTSVLVYLPRSSREVPRVADTPAIVTPTAETKDRFILVVDDDPLVGETVTSVLATIGCRYELLSDAASAIRRVLAGPPPDALLIDFAMPGMNGADAAAEIRAHLPDLPIIFMTGFADPAPLDRERFILTKPFRAPQLARILADALQPVPAAQ